jgi:DNA polymerase-3 subunit epsilon
VKLDIGLDRQWTSPSFPALQPFDWLALDVETATHQRGSVCAVGVAIVRGGEVVASGSQLIDPRCEFSPYNVAVHGIHPEHVAGAPSFGEFWPQLAPLLDGAIVAAHYASFDLGALRQCVAHAGHSGVTFNALCSWRMARRVWPDMASHSLGWLGPQLGFSFNHHEAGSDAEACARLVLKASSLHDAEDVNGLMTALGIPYMLIEPSSFRPVEVVDAVGGSGKPHRLEGDPDADPDHPLFGKTLCFTGAMYSMVRNAAADSVSRVGGNFVNNMSGLVDFLVVGDADFVGFADGQRTGKIEKLMQLRAKGKTHAGVIGERDFLALLRS